MGSSRTEKIRIRSGTRGGCRTHVGMWYGTSPSSTTPIPWKKTTHGCGPCVAFQPIFDGIARTWAKRKDQSHYFVTLDFQQSKDVFSKVRAQMPFFAMLGLAG